MSGFKVSAASVSPRTPEQGACQGAGASWEFFISGARGGPLGRLRSRGLRKSPPDCRIRSMGVQKPQVRARACGRGAFETEAIAFSRDAGAWPVGCNPGPAGCTVAGRAPGSSRMTPRGFAPFSESRAPAPGRAPSCGVGGRRACAAADAPLGAPVPALVHPRAGRHDADVRLLSAQGSDVLVLDLVHVPVPSVAVLGAGDARGAGPGASAPAGGRGVGKGALLSGLSDVAQAHSLLMAMTGSTRAARRAGSQVATSATHPRKAASAARVSGSRALTP